MLDKIDYKILDQVKVACIEASKKTRGFAEKFGLILGDFGSSANVFALDLKPFLQAGSEHLYVTLLPEGLGTADEARPLDLSRAELVRFWRNIGLKTLSVLTNDAASAGMQTVLISLYLPSAYPEIVFTPEFMEGFLDGFVEGCQLVGCVYFSGETPQLKEKLAKGKLDIAGALFGVVPAGHKPINSSELRAGDFIVFVESSGPHENGFTTLRSLAEHLPQGYHSRLPSGVAYWEAINRPGHLYTPLIQAILTAGIHPSNIEPITGHGWQKLMRPKKAFRYVVEKMLSVPEIFQFVEQAAGLDKEAMLRIFNYGVGLAIFVHSKQEAEKLVKIAESQGLKACIAGHVEEAAAREVVVKPLGLVIKGEEFQLEK